MIHVIRNQEEPWDIQVIAVGDRVAFMGVSILGIAFLRTYASLEGSPVESFGNGFVLQADAVEMAFESIDAAGLVTLTLG